MTLGVKKFADIVKINKVTLNIVQEPIKSATRCSPLEDPFPAVILDSFLYILIDWGFPELFQ